MLFFDRGTWLTSTLALIVVIAPSVSLAEERLEDRVLPSCEFVTEMAAAIMTARVTGSPINELMAKTDAAERRSFRWMLRLLIYDAYYGQSKALGDEIPEELWKKKLWIESFKMGWEMDCMRVKPWLDKYGDEQSQNE
ncbi:hypothetical protein [Rhodovulum sp. P5]|uniref:hypothetical protein n=1 Tax=Rhodovulum sp. P5 TaxID=1564506 RepID=UPI0009D9E53E|nr:hypothetical protein [Rhodovulum sp. P5]